MSTKIDIKAGERGVVRVFATDLGKDQVTAFDVAAALGAKHLDTDQLELFDIGDLQGLGLSGFLEDGHGIPTDQLTGMISQLDGLKGVVLIVASRAFGDQPQTLKPADTLRLVGTFFEQNQPVSFQPLPNEAAQGNVNTETKPRPSNAAMSGRVAMVALLVLALLVAVMIWIAG